MVFVDPIRFGLIVGVFLWVARARFGFFHPDDKNWLFFWRWARFLELGVLVGVSLVGISAILAAVLLLRGRRGAGMDEAARSLRRIMSPTYFLLVGLIQLVPGSLGVLPVLPLLNKLILPLSVFSSVLFLFVIETGLVSPGFVQQLDRSVPRHKWRWTITLFLASWLAYGVFTKRCDRVYGYTSGDEAHYLTQAESLAEDLDRDLVNQLPDYERSRRYHLTKHLSPKSPPGKAYSYHSIGLPVLLAPGWAVGGMKGAVGVVVTISSIFAVAVFWIALKLRGRVLFALGCWAIFCFTTPIIFYACRAYPELPSALIILLVVWRMTRAEKVGGWGWFGLACLLGYLPWLHIPRLAIPTFFLSAWGIVWIFVRGKKKHLAVFIPPLIVGALLIIVLNQYWYGYEWHQAPAASRFERLDPQAWTGGYYHRPQELFSCPTGLIGTFIDRYRGLLVNSPAYLIPVVGVMIGLFSRKVKFWRALWFWTFIVIYVPALSRRGWYGGACFPSRFLISALPLLLFPFAGFLSVRKDKVIRAMFAVLAAFSVWITLRMLLDPAAFFRGAESAQWTSPEVKLVGLFFPYAATADPIRYIEDSSGIMLFMLWTGLLIGLIEWVKKKQVPWHRAFNLAIAAILALPLLTAGIRRAVNLQPYHTIVMDPLGHYSALAGINRSAPERLHVARWGAVTPGVLKEELTLELPAGEQKSRTGGLYADDATGQKVVLFDPATDEPDYLSYSYPLKLNAGDYVVHFCISVEQWSGNNEILVDVQDMVRNELIASHRVTASDLLDGQEFSPVPLSFSLARYSKVSFRVYVDAKSTVRILKYSLQPGCLPELLAAVKTLSRE